jgi:MoxR-like ATPase
METTAQPASQPAAHPSIQSITESVQRAATWVEPLRREIGYTIVGQHALVDRLLVALVAGGHVLLEGVPGLAKTLSLKTLAAATQVRFQRLQFTPDMLPADIVGTLIYQPNDGRFVTRKGPIFANLVLADEINRAPAKVQSALLESMQERQVTIGEETFPLPDPFLVLATQNPIEQEGTYPLPEAQLDRFFFKLLVGYATRAEMHTILDRTTAGHDPVVEPVLDAAAIVGHQQLVRKVIIAPHVQDYAIRCVMATHPDGEYATGMAKQFIRFGASPRAAQALVLGGKVRALLDGRAHVSAADIRQVLLPALRHRVLLNFEGQAEGVTTDMVLNDIVDHVQVEQAVAR